MLPTAVQTFTPIGGSGSLGLCSVVEAIWKQYSDVEGDLDGVRLPEGSRLKSTPPIVRIERVLVPGCSVSCVTEIVWPSYLSEEQSVAWRRRLP